MNINLSYTAPILLIPMEYQKSAPISSEAFLTHLNALLIEKVFDSSYSVPKLCRDMGMSPSQLYRKTRAITGKSVIEIIIEMRLEKAKQLLPKYNQLSISEIAYTCGFEDPDYFSRAFSKRFGMSPKKWRTRQLAE